MTLVSHIPIHVGGASAGPEGAGLSRGPRISDLRVAEFTLPRRHERVTDGAIDDRHLKDAFHTSTLPSRAQASQYSKILRAKEPTSDLPVILMSGSVDLKESAGAFGRGGVPHAARPGGVAVVHCS